jgi:hypothetical protein
VCVKGTFHFTDCFGNCGHECSYWSLQTANVFTSLSGKNRHRGTAKTYYQHLHTTYHSANGMLALDGKFQTYLRKQQVTLYQSNSTLISRRFFRLRLQVKYKAGTTRLSPIYNSSIPHVPYTPHSLPPVIQLSLAI